ncbi:LysR family transcriptional regulator [Burkholderia multivorans]|uniref:immunity 52 family protein n=1 Tax=Burkholderia multivorans TaxID=87883 RepID=UPI00075F239B|nr:immunity 52 family protein [Burkholderia multivorans]KVV27668.1 LysR family transcriptional regulator [Burkholderia multivorans]MBU9309445.1 immunity 52 family protein [Burkholderia multivorans]MCO8314688.1 immunity 52 family protein [Burkholderia multivorans]MCO8425215.1 immunity 52 family protein [Burkholderia multivorans]MCO8438207.1 immunity 52 family protein [Burkholderia multivorans]
MDIRLKFKDDSLEPTNFSEVLSRIQVVTHALAEIEPTINQWYARGQTREEALLYKAFDDGSPSTAILAVLKNKFGDQPDATYVSLWDGNEDINEGTTISCHLNEPGYVNTFELSLSNKAILSNLDSVLKIVRAAATAFKPAYAAVGPRSYAARQVFDDKPGVGWMIYLPTVITQQQVPEAREVVATPEPGKNQTGTIIVSTTDAPFSMKNPEHIEAANRIEIRLVEQDLLPAFDDL